jgi:hypothetical protein
MPLARSLRFLPAVKRLSEKSLSLNFYIKLKHMVGTKATPTVASNFADRENQCVLVVSPDSVQKYIILIE